mmetsp:Transcript_10039/g.32715  ORF Transcript_10039/g.32715 Transcript_10039/m.32715 type:complete len:242 (-) Transcript_10039:41-766(-)
MDAKAIGAADVVEVGDDGTSLEDVEAALPRESLGEGVHLGHEVLPVVVEGPRDFAGSARLVGSALLDECQGRFAQAEFVVVRRTGVGVGVRRSVVVLAVVLLAEVGEEASLADLAVVVEGDALVLEELSFPVELLAFRLPREARQSSVAADDPMSVDREFRRHLGRQVGVAAHGPADGPRGTADSLGDGPVARHLAFGNPTNGVVDSLLVGRGLPRRRRHSHRTQRRPPHGAHQQPTTSGT